MFGGAWWFQLAFKWGFSLFHICMCVAGPLRVGGVKEQGDSRTGWQHALQRGACWQIVQASWNSTPRTLPRAHLQEQQVLEDKQAQIQIGFYLFLQPAVRFHSLRVYFAWVAKHCPWPSAVERVGVWQGSFSSTVLGPGSRVLLLRYNAQTNFDSSAPKGKLFSQ